MKEDRSEEALKAYLDFWRLDVERKRKVRLRRGRQLVLSVVSAAAVLVVAITFSLRLVETDNMYLVYLHGEKVTDRCFALEQMNAVMSDFPVVEQSVGEQLSDVFEVLNSDE